MNENNVKAEVIAFLERLLPECIIAAEFNKESIYRLSNSVLICVHLKKMQLRSGAMNDFLKYSDEAGGSDSVYGKLAEITLGFSIYCKRLAFEGNPNKYGCEQVFDMISEGLIFDEVLRAKEVERVELSFLPEFQVYCLEGFAAFDRLITKNITEIFPTSFSLDVKSVG